MLVREVASMAEDGQVTFSISRWGDMFLGGALIEVGTFSTGGLVSQGWSGGDKGLGLVSIGAGGLTDGRCGLDDCSCGVWSGVGGV